MSRFDFIADEAFRRSLEADYNELEITLASEAWKAVHVLAGSIIETLLVDYLIASNFHHKAGKDPLKMDLNELIDTCLKQNLISQRAADLSAVVRLYRNLIHPGRVARLNEKVDKNGAVVARALVDIVLGEVIDRRQKEFGYTAEQLANKVESDVSVLSIFEHLLRDISLDQLREFVLNVVPERYVTIQLYQGDPDEELVARMDRSRQLPRFYWQAFRASADTTRVEAAAKYMTILKTESGRYVEVYERAFFRGALFEYMPATERPIALKRLLERLARKGYSDDYQYADLIKGTGPYITVSECLGYTDGVVWALMNEYSESTRDEVVTAFKAEYAHLETEVANRALARLDDWHTFETDREEVDRSEAISLLKRRLSPSVDDFLSLDIDEVPF